MKSPLGSLHPGDNLTPELCDLMVKTGMNYFEIGITSGSQELAQNADGL